MGAQATEPGADAHSFALKQVLSDQQLPDEAARFVAVFRREGEKVFLQTFPDGPEELYVTTSYKDRNGQVRNIQKCRLATAGGQYSEFPTASGCSVTLKQLAVGPYLAANLARVGVGFAVNVLKPNATNRRNDEVDRVAAVFIDFDGGPLPSNFPVRPTCIVESSPGRFHVYWKVNDLTLEEFSTVQKFLADLYGADASVCDLARVMRLPGYNHGKNEQGFLTRIVELHEDVQYSRAELLGGWPALQAALDAAKAEREKQLEDAARWRAEAQKLQKKIEAGALGRSDHARVKYVQALLKGCDADLLAALLGTRNKTLNAVAYRVGRAIATGLLDETEARTALRETAALIHLGTYETQATINSGMKAGKDKPLDLSGVGLHAEKVHTQKSSKKSTLTTDEAAEGGLPLAEAIPDPEGENDTYSDKQLLALLQVNWKVIAVDTDLAHAHRLHDLAGPDLAHVPELGGYVAWNKKQWLSGGKNGPGRVEARRHVQGLGKAMEWETDRLLDLYSVLHTAHKRLTATPDADPRELTAMARRAAAMLKAYYMLHRVAKSTENDKKQQSILSSAETKYVKAVGHFQPRPWVIGFQNGTWDQGKFREARREDHLLHLTAVEYHKDADQSDWTAVLERMTAGDAELARTLQDVAGYALSGASSLRLLLWAYGGPGTGKGTFTELLATMLGDMATTVEPIHLTGNSLRERLGAAIWGKRLVVCAEAGNARLDAELLKTLSGGDRLPGRLLYNELFNFLPTHVLIMVANDPPRMEAYDDALKDRVLALPFKHPLHRKGQSLLLGGVRLESLRREPNSALARGFTAWAVEGLTRIYEAEGQDIHRAAACLEATQKFWYGVDELHGFWLTLNRAALLKGMWVKDVQRCYAHWCDSMDNKPLKPREFTRACESVGLDQGSNGKQRIWRLVQPAKFPEKADQEGEGELTVLTTSSSISQSSSLSLSAEEKQKELSENGPELVKTVSAPVPGWVGEDL